MGRKAAVIRLDEVRRARGQPLVEQPRAASSVPLLPDLPAPGRRGIAAALAASAAAHALALLLIPGLAPQAVVEPPLDVRLTPPQVIAPAAPVVRESQPAVPATRRHVARPASAPRILTAPKRETAPPAPSVPQPPADTAPPLAPAAPRPPVAAAAPRADQDQDTAPARSAPPVALTAPRYDAAYLDNPRPAYPRAARRLGQEGEVRLRVHVDTQGMPREVRLARSSGSSLLDDAALAQVARWRFVPARRGAEPVAAWVEVPIRFTLRDE